MDNQNEETSPETVRSSISEPHITIYSRTEENAQYQVAFCPAKERTTMRLINDLADILTDPNEVNLPCHHVDGYSIAKRFIGCPRELALRMMEAAERFLADG